jgi:hypothetical protein
MPLTKGNDPAVILRILLSLSGLLLVSWPMMAPRAQGYSDQDRYGNTVECRSRNYAFQRCPAPPGDVHLVRQLSDTQCIRGRSWGVDRQGLWVDRGCAGVFAVAGYGVGDGGPGPDWNQRFSIRCASSGYQYQFCAVDLGRGGRAYLDQQTSGTSCVEGETWGWNRAGIWVDRGCAGVFVIDRRWR